MNKSKFALMTLLSALLLTGCASKKATPAKSETKTETQREKNNPEGFRTLSMDKATFSIVNASGNRTSLNGAIRICRDSIIICSIRPFVGVNMEFARIGINKQGVTIVDRINKQYFVISYAEASTKFGMAMNYNTFESIFTDRVFVYGSPYVPLISDFKVTAVADQAMLSRSDDDVSQEFYMDAGRNLIGGMIAAGATYSMRWNYSQFEEVNHVNFPKRMSLKIAGPDFHRQIMVQYKQVELDRDRSFEFKIPTSYKKVSIDDILKSF